MNNKAHLRPQDYDGNGDIIPMSMKEEKGDLISREALKKALDEQMNFDENCRDSVFEIIDNAPTVETDIEVVAKDAYEQGYTDGWKERFGEPDERPQGEWNYIQAGMCVCPFCGAMPHKLYKNYCANCGAEMKGGAE